LDILIVQIMKLAAKKPLILLKERLLLQRAFTQSDF